MYQYPPLMPPAASQRMPVTTNGPALPQRPNPLMGGDDPRAQTMGYMLRGQQPQMAQGFQRPVMPTAPTFGGVQMAPAFRPPPSAQQPPSNAGLLQTQQLARARGY